MKTIKFKSATFFVACFIIYSAISSCTKDPVKTPDPQPVNQELSIAFSNSSVAFATIDSVVAIVRDQNNNIKLWKTFVQAATSFRLNLQQLAAGNYKAEVLAYSKKGPDFTARQYALAKDIQLPLQQTIILNAPTGSFTDAWYKRIVFFDGPAAATMIVAMDPRDAFYEVRLKQPGYTRVYLDRSSIDVNVLVAIKSKTRNIEGLLGFSEYGDFSPYVESMQGKSWTKGFISGTIEKEVGAGDIEFYYEYPNN